MTAAAVRVVVHECVHACPVCETVLDPSEAAADVVSAWVLRWKLTVGPLTPSQAALVDQLKNDLGIED